MEKMTEIDKIIAASKKIKSVNYEYDEKIRGLNIERFDIIEEYTQFINNVKHKYAKLLQIQAEKCGVCPVFPNGKPMQFHNVEVHYEGVTISWYLYDDTDLDRSYFLPWVSIETLNVDHG